MYSVLYGDRQSGVRCPPDQNSGSWATQSRFLLDYAYNYARTCDFDRLCVGITGCRISSRFMQICNPGLVEIFDILGTSG
jgi:hypothetical protein